MPQRIWSRAETLVAFNVYCRLPFGQLHARNPEIIRIASALGRTPGSLAMKCCNLASFDPVLKARGVAGLAKTSKLDREVWLAFETDPESLSYEAELALAALIDQPIQLADEVEWEDIRGLDREAITKVRVNQRFFREMILANYRERCAVCEIPFRSILVASHIVPWSLDKTERMNPGNGICLCSLHDKAFDTGLLRVTPEFSITLRDDIRDFSALPAIQDYFLKFDGENLILPDRWHPQPKFFARRLGIVKL